MERPKIRYSRDQYAKLVLEYMDGRRCILCKYDVGNYERMEMVFQKVLIEHCNLCLHMRGVSPMRKTTDGKIIPGPYITDNFKPLYEWEDDE